MANFLEAIGRNVPALSSSIADLIRTQEWSKTNEMQQQALTEDIRQKKATFDYEQKKWQEEQEFLDTKQTEDMIFGDMPNITPSQKKLLTGMGDKTGLWETVNGVRVMSNRNLKKAVTMMQTNSAFQKMLGEAGFADLNKQVAQIDKQLQDPEAKLKPEEREALLIQKKTINAQRQGILTQLTTVDKAIEEEKAKRELIDKLTTEGKHTPESIAEFERTGDRSKLRLIPEKAKEYAPQLKKWTKGKQTVYVDMNNPGEVETYQRAGFVEYEKAEAGEKYTTTQRLDDLRQEFNIEMSDIKNRFGKVNPMGFFELTGDKDKYSKAVNQAKGKYKNAYRKVTGKNPPIIEEEIIPEQPVEKYTVGKIYEDAQGKKAKYLGQGKWQTVK